MIFVDASAMVAVLLEEPDARTLFMRMQRGPAITSAVAIFETALAVRRRFESTVEQAEADVAKLTRGLGIEIVPIDPTHATLALDAHARFGKGHHPASLNMGDCFAYAMAKAHGAALLYKGDDFVKTDIASAADSA